jgi:glycosyltransferase involved in cell wall biosynthesis
MSKKRICLIIASPLTINFFHLEQITALAKRYDLSVITDTDDPGFLDYLGVPVRVIPVAIKRDVHLGFDLLVLMRLVHIFFRERFDLVHTLSPKSGLLGMIAARVAGIPVRIHTFQGEVWLTRKGVWRAILKSMDKLIARWATHLLVVSHSERDFLVSQGILQKEKSRILANGSICGVDTARFKPDDQMRSEIRAALGIPESDMVILYLGRLKVDKGLLDLAQAFSRLRGRFQNAHLLIVGPDEEGMRERMRDQCAKDVTRLHFVDYTDVPERYLAASDLLCLPSYREGFGLVLIEAAATGMPSVGSRIYGITDAIVEGKTGLLFSPGDIDELTGKLATLLDDHVLRATLGKAGRVRALNDFSEGLILSALFDYYDERLAG